MTECLCATFANTTTGCEQAVSAGAHDASCEVSTATVANVSLVISPPARPTGGVLAHIALPLQNGRVLSVIVCSFSAVDAMNPGGWIGCEDSVWKHLCRLRHGLCVRLSVEASRAAQATRSLLHNRDHGDRALSLHCLDARRGGTSFRDRFDTVLWYRDGTLHDAQSPPVGLHDKKFATCQS